MVSSTSTTKPPWLGEPDDDQFVAHGLRCRMKRNSAGVWCGYVTIPHHHPMAGLSYVDLYYLDVHGAVTYTASSEGGWVIGFDCNQSDDLSQAEWHRANTRPYVNYFKKREYRTHGFAKGETIKLAEQLWDALSPLQQLAHTSTTPAGASDET